MKRNYMVLVVCMFAMTNLFAQSFKAECVKLGTEKLELIKKVKQQQVQKLDAQKSTLSTPARAEEEEEAYMLSYNNQESEIHHYGYKNLYENGDLVSQWVSFDFTTDSILDFSELIGCKIVGFYFMLSEEMPIGYMQFGYQNFNAEEYGEDMFMLGMEDNSVFEEYKGELIPMYVADYTDLGAQEVTITEKTDMMLEVAYTMNDSLYVFPGEDTETSPALDLTNFIFNYDTKTGGWDNINWVMGLIYTTPSGEEKVLYNHPTVYAYNEVIRVLSQDESPISVYDLTGRQLIQQTATVGINDIQGLKKGQLYVVKQGNNVTKVSL